MTGAFPTLKKMQAEWHEALASANACRIVEARKYAAIVQVMEKHADLCEEISVMESLLAETKDRPSRNIGESDLPFLKQQLAAFEERLADFEREPKVAQRRSVIVELRPQTKDDIASTLTERLINELQEYAGATHWNCREFTIHEFPLAAERNRVNDVGTSLRCLRIDGAEVWYRLRCEAARYVLADQSPMLTVRTYPVIDEDEFDSSEITQHITTHPLLRDRAVACLAHEPSGVTLFADEPSAHRMRSTGTDYLRSRICQMQKTGDLPIRVLDPDVMSIRDQRLGDNAFSLGMNSLATRVEALLAWKRRESDHASGSRTCL